MSSSKRTTWGANPCECKVYDDRPKDEVLGQYFSEEGIQTVGKKSLAEL